MLRNEHLTNGSSTKGTSSATRRASLRCLDVSKPEAQARVACRPIGRVRPARTRPRTVQEPSSARALHQAPAPLHTSLVPTLPFDGGPRRAPRYRALVQIECLLFTRTNVSRSRGHLESTKLHIAQFRPNQRSPHRHGLGRGVQSMSQIDFRSRNEHDRGSSRPLRVARSTHVPKRRQARRVQEIVERLFDERLQALRGLDDRADRRPHPTRACAR